MYGLLLAVPALGWFGVQLYPALDVFCLVKLPAVVAPDKAASGMVLQAHAAAAFALLALAALLERRRTETARATWLNLALAFFFRLLWAWSLQSAPGGFTDLLLLLSGLGVCLLFLARVVVEAHTNWQIRTGGMGTLREFLLTDEGWMPS